LPKSAATALGHIAHFRHIPAGQVIESPHQAMGAFAVIISGVVKLVRTQYDGRQQIVGLRFPADFLGRPYSTRNALIAQATTSLELCCFSKDAFEILLQEHPCLGQALLRRTLDDLDESREWMFLLAQKTAREKVACLLFSIAVRSAQPECNADCDQTSLEFDLPLSRHEIADTLGLTIETVSREIRYLRSQGVIATEGRRGIVVPHLGTLRGLAEVDRQQPRELAPLTEL
jgi:CRP/FNR family transcriptional regulator